ncbi:MAG: BMP family ABC transporter substrate-binding protein [Fimbriimonadaceae bacterium]|nr:BMP family ABC transporter substrate-binding protein [Fimbriimonadaceae bacterium]
MPQTSALFRFPVRTAAFVLATTAVLLMGGCNPPAESDPDRPESKSSEGKSAETKSSLKVGVVFDSGGRGDKSFNDSAYAGVERAKKELGTEFVTVDSKKESDYVDNLTAMAEAGNGLVFAVGLGQAKALEEVAPKFPDVKFALVDANVDAPNVRSLTFSEEQGSFLAGIAAAMVSKTGKVGFVGGKNIPLIHKFEAGYTAGAQYFNPGIQVLPAKYTDSWDDTSRGKAAASLLYAGGADVVFHAAGRAGLGVFAAAKEANGSATPATKFAIGVDSNQDDVEKGIVLTSMVKRVDEAVFATIQDVLKNEFTPGSKTYDLAKNGVGLTDFANTKTVIGDANLAKIAAIRKRVESGELSVPTKREEVAAFLKSAPK